MPDFFAWQTTALAAPQALAACSALIACLVVWPRRHDSPLGDWLVVMLAGEVLWAGSGALEFSSASLPAKIFWSRVSYAGIALGPISLLHFTYAYLGGGAPPPRLARALAYGCAAAIVTAAWTNPWHGWLWPEVTAVRRDGLLFSRYERGPFFWLTVAYCYGFMLSNSVLLVRHSLRLGGLFSRQSGIILLATLAPWITSIAYLFRLGPWPELDHTPVGFTATGLLLAAAVVRFRLFQSTPIPANTLFARIPDPVLATDTAGALVRANTAAIERFAIPAAAPGEPLERVLRGRPELVAALRAHPEPRFKRTLHADDTWWEIESGPLDETPGRASGRLLLLRDITAQKRNELLLAEALARAETLRREADAANAAKSTFLTQVSHDLRTPLHAILGMSELMLAGPLDEQLRADTRTIHDAGGILLRLINDLLDLSRIEAGHLDLAHEPFALAEAVVPVAELLSVKARGKGLDLVHRVDPALPVHVCGDVARLRQILLNLGGNAVKFTVAGSVSIDAAPADPGRPADALCIRVSDTGPGIPADRLPTLFDPFDRGDTQAVRQIEGTGLGLAIARRLAEAMGGSIAVESAVGRGTVFTLRLPILPVFAPPDAPGLRRMHPEAAAADAPAPSSAPPWPSAGLRILLADDQELSRRVSSALLRRCGCEVVVVQGGHEALAAAAREPFDAFVLDGQMGGLDGWVVAARIRQGEAGAGARRRPIFALTADLSAEARQAWLAAGADLVLGKPAPMDALAHALAGRVRRVAPAEA